MPINFLYIDDEEFQYLRSHVESLESASGGALAIQHSQVMKSISATVNYLVQNADCFQGLIIDQELTAVSKEGHKADYYGTTLAQQLRTEMASKNVKYLPLILLSNETVIVRSFIPDDASQNLFDYVIQKSELRETTRREKIVKVLASFVSAYKVGVNFRKAQGTDLSSDDVRSILDCDENIMEGLDSRFVDYISGKAIDPHALTSSIYSTLIQSAGILVTERMLQTKLGISENSPNWLALKTILKPYKYTGIFSDIKERWWLSGIEDWWFDLYPENVLQSLSATERVSILTERLGIDGLTPIEKKYELGDQSDHYWVNCVISETPLDPIDALRIRNPDAKPWEQAKYVDLQSMLDDPGFDDKYAIHSDDKSKVKRLIQRLKPNANN